MKKLDIVLIGFNGYGKYYAEFLFENPYSLSFNFCGVVDPFLTEQNKALLQSKNIPFFDRLEDFYAGHGADLAIIAAPIHFHKSFCETAAQNGSGILCEKPATARLCDLYEMHGYETQYHKDIFIGFQWSYTDPIVKLKADLLRGKFGRILSAKTLVLWSRNLAYYNRSTGWAGKIKTADGSYIYDSVASNATAHYLNNLLFLLGDGMETAVEVKEFEAECFRANPIETFDTCVLRARTVKGQDILFAVSHAVDRNTEPVFEIACEKAVIRCDFAKDNGMLAAKLKDGGEEVYGQVNTLYQKHRKIVNVINWLSDPQAFGKPATTVMTTLPFTAVINRLFENVPFREFDSGVIFDEANDRFYVEGLAEKLTGIYNAGFQHQFLKD